MILFAFRSSMICVSIDRFLVADRAESISGLAWIDKIYRQTTARTDMDQCKWRKTIDEIEKDRIGIHIENIFIYFLSLLIISAAIYALNRESILI